MAATEKECNELVARIEPILGECEPSYEVVPDDDGFGVYIVISGKLTDEIKARVAVEIGLEWHTVWRDDIERSSRAMCFLVKGETHEKGG